MKFARHIPAVKATMVLAMCCLVMSAVRLEGQEAVSSESDVGEQTKAALAKLRAKAKAAREQWAGALRQTKARHIRQRADTTSVDPYEVREAEERLSLISESIRLLDLTAGEVTRLWEIHSFETRALFLYVEPDGRIHFAHTDLPRPGHEEFTFTSTRMIDAQVDALMEELRRRPFGKALLLYVQSVEGRIARAITVLDDTITARKRDSAVWGPQVDFPYNARYVALKQAELEVQSAQAKAVPAKLINRQRDELRETADVEEMVNGLRRQVVRAVRRLKAVADSPEQFSRSLREFDEATDELDRAVDDELARIKAKYERRILTNSAGMTFVKTAAGHYILVHDANGREPNAVTVRHWTRVMGGEADPVGPAGLDVPIEVTWQEAESFCDELRRREDRQYDLSAEDEQKFSTEGGRKEPSYTGKNARSSSSDRRKLHPRKRRPRPTRARRPGRQRQRGRPDRGAAAYVSSFSVILKAD